jgi:hypothetical protein
MPPKKVAMFAANTDADKNKVPQWRYRNDASVPEADPSGWSPYTQKQSEAIEAGYIRGLKTVNIGPYYVDTKQKLQTHVDDTLKTRKIRRFLVDGADLASGGMATVVRGATAVPSPAGNGKTSRDDPSASTAVPALKVSRVDDHFAFVSRTPPLSHVVSSTPPSSVGAPTTLPSPMLHPSTMPTSAPTMSVASDVSILSKRVPSSDVRFPGRPEASTQPIVFLPKLVDTNVLQVIRFVLETVPTINRRPLDDASVLIQPTRRWLRALGRPEKQQGVFISLPQPLNDQPDARRLPVSETSVMTVQQARTLADTAVITYVGARPTNLLLPNESQSMHASLSYKDHLKTQQLMISGPVRVLYDGRYKPLPKPPVVVVCSIPGINFAYSDIDRHYFTKPSDDDDVMTSSNMIDKEKVLRRMRLVWQHLLLVMDDKYRVQFPVLCGIGCGAFKGVYGAQIPRLWGRALAEVLCNSTKVLKHVRAIFVSLPTFGKDNNFAPFQHSMHEVLKDNADVPYCPIVLVEDASMVDIAVALTTALPPGIGDAMGCSSTPPVVGMLNPSDVQAIRHGWVGMYWDGGHIALEEVLAMQTTLLLHHVGLNRELFCDPSRMLPIKKVLPDMEE